VISRNVDKNVIHILYTKVKKILASSGVLRVDGARGKKQVWHPHVRT